METDEEHDEPSENETFWEVALFMFLLLAVVVVIWTLVIGLLWGLVSILRLFYEAAPIV